MDASASIPLHFTLELVGLVAYAALAAWAAQGRRWVFLGGAASLAVSQAIHTGQFVAGEQATTVVALRVAGLVAIAVGLRIPDRERHGAPQAAAGGGAAGLAWAGAAVAGVVAVARRGFADRPLWASAWGGVAVAEAWAASAAGGSVLLADDLGPHLLRAAAWLLLGGWVWRRTVTSLRLRVIAAFALVLFSIVVVAGGAVLRVGAANARDDELRSLSTTTQAQRALFVTDTQRMRNAAAVVSRTFTAARSEGTDASLVARDLHEQVYDDLAFVALFGRDGAVVASSGLEPAVVDVVASTDSVRQALAGGAVPPVSLEALPDRLLAVAAAPVFPPGSRDRVDGTAVLGLGFGRPALAAIAAQAGEDAGLRAAVVVPGRRALVASVASFADATLPSAGADAVRSGRVWTGELTFSGERFFAAAAPLAVDAVDDDDGPPPALVLASPGSAVADAALAVSRALLAAILAAALIAVVIALWLSDRISRPVIELTATARRIEGGDLLARPAVVGRDEIAALAGAFGSMTTTLQDTISSERDTRTRLETIVGGMTEGLIAMDEDFTITSFNPAAERITGVPASEAIGRTCHEVYGDATSGRDDMRICDHICPLRYDGGTDTNVTLTRPDGTSVGVSVSCSVLRDADGRVVGGVDLLRDVTAEQEAERMKTNLLANISHELRTPLTPIRGYADILRRKDVPREKAVEYLGEIVTSAGKLERVVSMLVDVAAIEAGRLEVSPAAFDVRMLVHETAAAWDERTPTHDVKGIAAKALPQVEADRELVRKVLDELVGNAVKFSPDGGKVVVRAKRVRSGLEVSVKDEGVGIAADDARALFEGFTQADPSATRRFGGLGLGLTFVQRVLLAHDAELRVDSRPGRGSTFSFVLPVADGREGDRRRGRGGRRSGTARSRTST